MNSTFSIFAVLERSAARWPDRTALVDGAGEVGYATLLREAEETADRLVAHGVREGDGVGVRVGNNRWFVIAAFAALRCGATVMPLSRTLTPPEYGEILRRTPLHHIVTDTPDHDGAAPLRPKGALVVQRTERSRAERIVDLVPDAAFVRYTSGTTGTAKGVVLSHDNVRKRIEAAGRGLGLTERDTILFVLPMAFHFYVSVVLYLHAGATTILGGDLDGAGLAETLVRSRATMLYASPLHYRMLAAQEAAEKPAHLRLALSTSSGLSPVTADEVLARHGIRISQAYGIIEVGLPLVNLHPDESNRGGVGAVLPGYEAAILDGEGRELPPGKSGELAVRGPGMFSAYLDPFQPREEVLRGGWFLTGDMAVMDPEKRVTVLGRKKSMINVCGEKVFPEEVEHVLEGHPLVVESHVFGAAHPRMGEVVHARVVVREPVDPEELIRYARGRLSPFKVPQRVKFVEHLGRTASGKMYRWREPPAKEG
ncbi:MAG: FadD7 family fatty acid--CoA ligase [Desulfobulbaceae bacterium]